MVTTIQLEERIKNKLEGMKIHQRETYSKVIERLIQSSREEEVLSPQTIKNIESSLEDVKRGRVCSTKEVKNKLGIK
jgi:predicted transcriptional regulator